MDNQLDLASELNRLRNRLFWTQCTLGIALLCFAAVSVAIWRKQPQTVEANEFLIKGKAGNIAARLGQDSYGDTCLTLTAAGSASVANMCVQDEGGATLDLHNLKSESRATLTPGFYMHEPLMQVQPALIIDGVNYATRK